MRQVIATLRTPPRLAEVPVPSLKSGGILVQVAYSAISVGTERSAVSSAKQGLLAKARSKPDKVLQVLRSIRQSGMRKTLESVNDTLDRWTPLGYSCSGIVIEVGSDVSEFRVGDRVACSGGGYASHAEVCFVPRRLASGVPDAVSLDHAAFATIGAIAMQGVRQAEVSIGERVAVIGLGIVGQIACQIATAAGCQVIALDVNPERVELATHLGSAAGIVIGRDQEREAILRLTHGLGVDAVVLTASSASDDPIRLSADLCRDRGRVVIVGAVGMGIERQTAYDKELEFKLSRSYGPGRYDPSYEERGVDYPIGYVRWTEQRNVQAVLELLESGRLQLESLITHRFDVADAAEAYDLISSASGASALGVLLEYPGDAHKTSAGRTVTASLVKPQAKDTVGIGFIGAGEFARSILIPGLRDLPVRMCGIATSKGLTAADMAGKFGFEYADTDADRILGDPSIDLVFIATRHDSHAQFVVQALRAGKSVFVEKPIAVTLEELEEVAIAKIDAPGEVMIGFNRRFAPILIQALDGLGPNRGSLAINIRVNAPALSGHWTQAAEAGGRIIGEACHFVDLAQFIAGSRPVSVYARAMPVSGAALEESVAATLEFENGSIANLLYETVGSPKVEKESIEIFTDGKAAIITDFRSLRTADGKTERMTRVRQDKGHKAEIEAFVARVRSGGPSPIPFDQAIDATLATLAIVESCRTCKPIDPRRPFEVNS